MWPVEQPSRVASCFQERDIYVASTLYVSSTLKQAKALVITHIFDGVG